MKDSILASLLGLMNSDKLDEQQRVSVMTAYCLIAVTTDEGVNNAVNAIYKNKA